MRKQGLQHTTEEPLLLSLLHRYMAHGDPMLSPRIAAKAKSSIAAKPGGEKLHELVFALAHMHLIFMEERSSTIDALHSCQVAHALNRSKQETMTGMNGVGHTVNISAPAPQAPLRQAADVIKAAHYPTPPLVPAAAAAAAAMHPGAQQQRSSQLQNIAGAQLGSTSPHSISPVASRSASPLGEAARYTCCCTRTVHMCFHGT